MASSSPAGPRSICRLGVATCLTASAPSVQTVQVLAAELVWTRLFLHRESAWGAVPEPRLPSGSLSRASPPPEPGRGHHEAPAAAVHTRLSTPAGSLLRVPRAEASRSPCAPLGKAGFLLPERTWLQERRLLPLRLREAPPLAPGWAARGCDGGAMLGACGHTQLAGDSAWLRAPACHLQTPPGGGWPPGALSSKG